LPSLEPDLQSPFFRTIGLPFCKGIAFVLMTIFGPFRARFRKRLPKSGGLLVLANHVSDVDPVAVQLACPRPVYFMAKSELFEMKLLGRMIRWFRAFPVKRGEPDRDAIKKAVAYLQAGQVVCIFPEGQLSPNRQLQELKSGVALIARMSQVPVICCRLTGTERVMPYGFTIPRPAFQWVEAVWSDPRSFGPHASAEEILSWARAELSRPAGR
jgi:1-acyl-sn-glycerol-3-phosphate acyltransferase